MKVASLSQMFELRAEKMVCVPFLKIQIEALEDIGAMVSPHGNQPRDVRKADSFRESGQALGNASRCFPDNPVSAPEFVAEEPAGRA